MAAPPPQSLTTTFPSEAPMTAAIFQGSYCDLKFVKSRSVAQITIEIPIEKAQEFVAAFGAPNPSAECPVAIARLDASSKGAARVAEAMTKERRKWSELPLSQQAAMRCNEAAFQKFVHEFSDGFYPIGAQYAAEFVRKRCDVQTRSDILTDNDAGMKWTALNRQFEMWMRNPDVAA